MPLDQVENLHSLTREQLHELVVAELEPIFQRDRERWRAYALRRKQNIALGCLGLLGLILLGLGISLCAGAPLWLTLLGATASTVGYISLGLGISALLGTLMGLAWLYKDNLTARTNHDEDAPLLQHEPAERRVPTSPVTPPENPIVNSTQPPASPTYSQALFLTADSLTNATSLNTVNSATAQ